MKTPTKCHAPEHDHRYEEASIKAMRQDVADNPDLSAAPAQAQHSPITEAYDIKNVDIRNLLTVAVGTLSNQTGESFDSALSRGKCADEILRRFHEMQSQINEHINALRLTRDHEKQLAEQRDQARAHAQRLADALRNIAANAEEANERRNTAEWDFRCTHIEAEAKQALAEWSKSI